MIFMEIRNVVNKVENEYPKMEQISKKHLSNSVPRKWLKVGLSSLVIAILTKNKAFAISINTLDLDMPLAGAPIQICNVACPIVQIASAVVFIITGLSILITKIKSKKQNEPKKIKKWVKVLFIISIIAFIISVLTNFIINTIDYY